VLLVGALLAGCDDDPLPVPDLAVADLAVPGVDGGPDFSGVLCGGEQACGSSSVCCVREVGDGGLGPGCEPKGDCLDGGAQALCDGPEDCAGAVCCGHLYLGGNVSMNLNDAELQCRTDCIAEVSPVMGRTLLVSRLCHGPADCIGLMGEIFGGTVAFNGCCARQDAPVHFCAPDDRDFATLGKYTCQ